MISITFNTVVDLLEREFHIAAARLRPDTRLVDIGFDVLSVPDLLLAIEDAFRLHLPVGDGALRDPATDLLTLCEVLEAVSQALLQTQSPSQSPSRSRLQSRPQAQAQSQSQSQAPVFARSMPPPIDAVPMAPPWQAASAAATAHSPSR